MALPALVAYIYRFSIGLITGFLLAELPHYLAWLDEVSQLVGVTPRQRREGLTEVPHWWVPAFKMMPRRRLNASEREALRRDGGIVVRDLIPNQDLLAFLAAALGCEKHQRHHSWYVNGLVHGLVKHSPLPELAASALDVPEVTIWNTQVEPRPGRAERKHQLPEKPWHDQHYGDPLDPAIHDDVEGHRGTVHRAGHFTKPLASFFLAVSDVPHGLELLAGSHVANQRHRCLRGQENRSLDVGCMERLASDCLGVRWWDLRAGDALLFYGATFHWTVLQERPRLALSIRYVPADMLYTGKNPFTLWQVESYFPWKCSPVGGHPATPILYTSDLSRMKDQPWPLWPRNKDVDRFAIRALELLKLVDLRCGPIYDF